MPCEISPVLAVLVCSKYAKLVDERSSVISNGTGKRVTERE